MLAMGVKERPLQMAAALRSTAWKLGGTKLTTTDVADATSTDRATFIHDCSICSALNLMLSRLSVDVSTVKLA